MSTRKIPLSAPDIGAAERAAVLRVLEGSQLCMGPELRGFESEFAARIGVDDAVAVSSGTAGLHIALITLGIGPGDQVIIPSFAFVAVVNVLLQVGARPVFAEIDPLTLNITADTIEAALTPQTRAVLLVHTFGVPADSIAIRALCLRRGLKLVEDACEALGAAVAGKPVGSFGDAAIFAFYPNKQITTCEGGIVIARGTEHTARLRRLRNQGRGEGDGWLEQTESGFSYRLSDIACALGRVQLARLDEILTLRQAAALRYDQLLGVINNLERPITTLDNRTISWFVYVIRLNNFNTRERVASKLAEQGIQTQRYFAPIHQTKFWLQSLGGQQQSLPITEREAARVLALPFFARISADDQQYVAQALRNALE